MILGDTCGVALQNFSQAFFNIFEKLNGLKNSTIFQAKTQQTGTKSSHMNFKTHFIFSTFAENEQKSEQMCARRATSGSGAFLPEIHQKQSFFSKI